MIDITQYGWDPAIYGRVTDGIPARVTAVHRERYELACEHGFTYGRLKTAAYYGMGEDFPTVGDFVAIRYAGESDSQILATLPRRSYFSRLDPVAGRGEQAVAANFDYVFVMTSLNNDFNLRRVERYMAAAWQSGATPVVVLTKADLPTMLDERVSAAEAAAPGVVVVAVSSVNGEGLDRLRGYLSPGKTAVFLGSSGVGKSSLVNALAGEMIMDVKAIREDDSRGRHTTTHRQLIILPSGAMLIDTPGMRQLGVWDAAEGIGSAFADVDAVLARGCRFADCTHRTEPGCAIKDALASGELSPKRWESYSSLMHENKYTENRVSFMREKQQRNKQIAVWSRSRRIDRSR